MIRGLPLKLVQICRHSWLKAAAVAGPMLRMFLSSRKFQGLRRGDFLRTPFPKCFASGEGTVSVHSLAVYIHEQINGTFEDIFPKIYDRVNTLEYPNNGSATLVTMDDAVVIVEDIGAHADDLPTFLADDKNLEKSIGFPLPHPLDDHGCSQAEKDLSTEEIRDRSMEQAEGIWFKPGHSRGFKVYSRTATINLTHVHDKSPTDPEFNIWYRAHRSPGWMACGGACANGSPPRWWNVEDEDPPFMNRDLSRKLKQCIGYCILARRAQRKG